MTRREDTCWWLSDRSKAAEHVTAMANSLLDAYGRSMRRRMNAYRAVYLNEAHAGYEEIGYRYLGGSKYNVTQGGVDSLHAKLALSRPRPKILPGSRRFKAKRKAKTLQRWIDGLFKRNATDKLQDDQLHDAEIYGAGVVKVVAAHGHVAHERRHPGNLLTDPREEQTGVRSLFEVASIDREVLAMSDFVDGSKMRERIYKVDAPPEYDEITHPDRGAALDQVKVFEAWRLPSCPGKPGRHVMAVGDIVLLDDPWHWDKFPFSVLVWGRDPERTMQGQGIVQRGLTIQGMLNHHCNTVDESFHLFVPKYGVMEGSGVDATVINRKVGQVIPYTHPQGAPVVLSPGPISPDFLAYAAELANRWFATTGISEADARAEADPSLESGKAKLIQGDINSGRFYSQGKGRERACVTLAELSIKMADLICEEHEHRGRDEEEGDEHGTGEEMEREPIALVSAYDEEPEEEAANEAPALEVPAGRDSWRESIPYAAARMSGEKDESFAIEVWPVSSLSQSVAGRMEEVAQLEASGHITDPQQARELLDIPVLNDFQDLASARREASEREIDRCLDGEQGIPSAYHDLQHALEHATKEYCMAGIEGADEDAPEAMECLRNFIAATERLIAKTMPAPAPPPDPMAGAPPVPPMPMMPGPMPMDPMAGAA